MNLYGTKVKCNILANSEANNKISLWAPDHQLKKLQHSTTNGVEDKRTTII